MAEFASKGVAGAGLGLGIAGTALGLLNGGAGLLGIHRNVYGTNYGYGNDTLVNRYELAQESRISKLESEVALRDANIYGDQKLLEVYKYFDGQIRSMEREQCEKWANQGIINANLESGVSVLGNQVANINNTIASVTKQVIPNSAVCPGWGNACVQPTGCSTVAGYDCNTF